MSHGLFHELLNHLFPYIKYGMTKAFGCINGTHVPILRPIENSQDCYCYMMFFYLFKQFVSAQVFLWMWTAESLTLSTMPNCFAIQK